jgi:hypothetical protein
MGEEMAAAEFGRKGRAVNARSSLVLARGGGNSNGESLEEEGERTGDWGRNKPCNKVGGREGDT